MIKLSLLIILWYYNVCEACDYIVEINIKESIKPGLIYKGFGKFLSNIDPVNSKNYYLTSHIDYFEFRNGDLYLKESIDREKVCAPSQRHQTKVNHQCCHGACCLYLRVDMNQGARYVQVKVEDDNDNYPKFQQSLYVLEILENTRRNSKIPLSTATDDDLPINGVKYYSIEPFNATLQKYFHFKTEKINRVKTPVLVIRQEIDREKVSKFDFVLFAKDGGRPAKSGSTRYSIQIQDVNDNTPKFDKTSYQVYVRENAKVNTILRELVITDPDEKDNGRIGLDFTPDTKREVIHTFQLISRREKRAIRLVANLDYEKHMRYEFGIVAKDNGDAPKSSTASVTVIVQNVNDAAPVIVFFSQGKQINRHYGRIYVQEGDASKDEVLCRIKVSDEDSTVDALSCAIDGGGDSFYLTEVKSNSMIEDEKSYQLRSSVVLDRERRSKYFVTIGCKDSSLLDYKKTTERLEIHVRDVNDNAPKFTANLYEATVRENQINTLVKWTSKRVQASDEDEAENGTIKYEIASVENGLTDHFSMDTSTGEIRVLRALDYEKIRRVKMVVKARDCGKLPLSATTEVVIKVQDVNDNVPQAVKPYYEFRVCENEPKGTLVGRVNFNDTDTEDGNRKILLKIIDNNHKSSGLGYRDAADLFSVNSNTGNIFTRMKLDRERTPVLMFTIEAKNPRSFVGIDRTIDTMNSFASVTVKVLDRNDNKPILIRREHTYGSLNKPRKRVPIKNPEVHFYLGEDDTSAEGQCVQFPYRFIDPDRDDDSGIGVEAKISDTRKIFRLDIDQGMICVDTNKKLPPIGVYKVRVEAKDQAINLGNTDNNCSQNYRSQSVQIWLTIKVKKRNNEPNLPRETDNNGYFDRRNPEKSERTPMKDNYGNSKSRFLKSNMLYVIVGCVAAILLLILLGVLVCFRKTLGWDFQDNMNSSNNNDYPVKIASGRSENDMISAELFDNVPHNLNLHKNKYNAELMGNTIKTKQMITQYRPDLDYKTLTTVPINGSQTSSQYYPTSQPNPMSSTTQLFEHDIFCNSDQQFHNYQSLATGHIPINSDSNIIPRHNTYQSPNIYNPIMKANSSVTKDTFPVNIQKDNVTIDTDCTIDMETAPINNSMNSKSKKNNNIQHNSNVTNNPKAAGAFQSTFV